MDVIAYIRALNHKVATQIKLGLIFLTAPPMRFGSLGPSDFFLFSDTPPKYLERDCVGRHRTGTRLCNVYRSVGEKQGIVTRNYCLSATCFTNSDISARCFTSISRAPPPENHKYQSPARSQIFAMEKTWFFERAVEMEHRS